MATLRMPSSLAARNTRMAISPRFAANSFLNLHPGADRPQARGQRSARYAANNPSGTGGAATASAGRWAAEAPPLHVPCPVSTSSMDVNKSFCTGVAAAEAEVEGRATATAVKAHRKGVTFTRAVCSPSPHRRYRAHLCATCSAPCARHERGEGQRGASARGEPPRRGRRASAADAPPWPAGPGPGRRW